MQPHEQHEKVPKHFGNILNKLDLANRGQRLGPTSTCHHRLVFVQYGTLTRNRHNNNFRFVTERLEYSKVRYCFC